MSLTSDLMELREADIVAHYPAAEAMLDGFEHAPRIARDAGAPAEAAERSPGIAARRRFRSTTPGLVTRRAARPDGVHLLDRIAECDSGDPLVSPAQAQVMRALRRALAISLALAETFGEQTPLAELKRANLAGDLPAARKGEFSELLAAEALVTLHVFGNALAFLLAPHLGEVSVEPGEVEEVLTDHGQIALHGALWELDRALAAHLVKIDFDRNDLLTGTGLMQAIYFKDSAQPQLAAQQKAMMAVDGGAFAAAVNVDMFKRQKILIQIPGPGVNAVKILPPATCTQEDLDYFLNSFEDTIAQFYGRKGPVVSLVGGVVENVGKSIGKFLPPGLVSKDLEEKKTSPSVS